MSISNKIGFIFKVQQKLFKFQFVEYSKATSRKMISEAKLCKKTVNFKNVQNETIELEAVYEDSLSSGSSVGTVVAFHGSPGSHNDFKYIRDKLDEMSIRFIGVNYPGFNFTDLYSNQDFGNVDRQNYSNALLKELDIQGKIVFAGHSRGCENALMTSVENNSDGLIMINPIGLRRHKGISPQWRLETVEGLYGYLPATLGNAMMYKIYQSVGFKVDNGIEAISALRSMNRCAIEGQLPFIERLNKLETKLLFLYAGRDHLMEKEIMTEVLEKYEKLEHFTYEKEINDEEIQKITSTFNKGKGAAVFVQKDTHFQNKSQAELIARSIQFILENSSKTSKI